MRAAYGEFLRLITEIGLHIMDAKRIGVLVDGLSKDLRKAIKQAAAMGAGAVQLPVGPTAPDGLKPKDLSQSAAREIRHTIANAGLQLCSAHAEIEMYLHQTGRLDELFDVVAAHLQWATRLSVPVLTTSIGALPPADEENGANRATAIDALRRMGNFAQREGLLLALSSGPATAAQLAADLTEVASDTIGANFDPGRLALRGPVDGSAVEALAGRIFHVHATDGILGQGLATVGEGDVNWDEIPPALNDVGYPGCLVIRTEGGANARSMAQRAVNLLGIL